MPIFSAIGAAVGVAVGGGLMGASGTLLGLNAAAWGAGIGQLLGGVALNALSTALANPGGQPTPSIRLESARGIVSRSFIVGRTMTPGSVFYEQTHGLGDPEEKKYYIVGHCLSDIPVRRLVELWVDDRRCTVDWSTYEALRGYRIVPPGGPDDDFDAWVTFYDGTQTTADPVLLEAAEDGYGWDATDILTGCAYAVVVFKANIDTFPSVPQVQYVVDGIRLRDAETDTIGTGDDLVAVQCDNLLSGIFYDGELFYGPQTPGILENAAEQIAKCRAPVPGAENWTTQQKNAAFGSTTVPSQFRAGLEIPVSMPIADALKEIMAAGNAQVAFTGSGYRLLCGEPGDPVATVTSEDIVITRSQRFAPFLPLAETINSVIGIYPEPSRKWTDREVKPLVVPSYEAEDGDRRLPTTVQLRTVSSGEQLQRLMKAALAEARRAARITVTLPPKFSALQPLDVVALTDPRTGSDAKRYRIDGFIDEPNGDVTLDFTEVDPEDYSYEAGDFAPGDGAVVTPQRLGLHYLLGFSAEAYTITDNSGVPRRPAIRMSWLIDQTGRHVAYQVVAADTGSEITKSTAALQDGGTLTADGIVPGETYRVRGRKLLGRGKTPWSDWIPVTVANVQLGPDDIRQDLLDDLVAQADYSQAVADDITALQEAVAFAQGDIDQITGEFIVDLQNGLDGVEGEIATLQLRTGANEASLTNILGVKTTGTSAFAALMNQLRVNSSGVSAEINDFAQVATEVDGFATAYAGVTVQTSGGSIAGFKATSFTNPNGTGGSLLQLLGDAVKVGTMSIDRFSSGNGANGLKNANFMHRLRYWRRAGTGNVFDQTTLELREPGSTFATPSDRTLRLRQQGISLNGYCDARAVDEKQDGTTSSTAVAVEAGKFYMASAQVCTRECSGSIFLIFMDALGNGLGTYEALVPLNSGPGNNPEGWPRIHTFARVAPAGAAAATIFIRKNGTQGGASESNLYAYKPSLEDTHAAATVPAPWTNGGTSLIEGGSAFFENSVGTYALNTFELAATGLALFGADVRSTNYLQGVRGWRIPIDGPAEFPLGIKTGDLSNNAATDADRANGGEVFNATDTWQTMCQMTFTNLNASSYDILGILQIVLTNDPSAYPNDFAVQLLLGADLGVLINKNTLNANGNSRFLVFPIVKVAETAGTLKLELRTRNGGGSGILNSNMWAMVRKK